MSDTPSRLPWLVACLALVCFDVLFLGEALFSDSVRAPWDRVIKEEPLASELPDIAGPVANPLLSDWALQFAPWSRAVRTAYEHGRLPLWNHLAGGGEPLAGNPQAEVFSPYTPLNLLGGDDYWDLKQLAILVIAQCLCLMLVAALRWSVLAGVVTALGFSLCCYLQCWILHPHAGSAAFAPGVVLGFVLMRRRFSLRRLALTAVMIGLSILAGHPETAFMCGLLGGAIGLLYFPAGRPVFPGTPAFVVQGVLAGALGLALAAPAVVPFAEYLAQSEVIDARRAMRDRGFVETPSAEHLFTLADPDALGGAVGTDSTYRGHVNYFESSLFQGRLLLALAAAGLLLGCRRHGRLVVPLLLTTLLGYLAAYGAPGLRDVLGRVPPFEFMPVRRLVFLGALPLALLAGAALDAGRRREEEDTSPAQAVIAFSTPLALAVVVWLLLEIAGLGAQGARPEVNGASLGVILLGAALLALSLAPQLARPMRNAAALLLLLGIAAEGWVTWRDLVPISPRATVAPRSEAFERLVAQCRDGTVLPLGWALPPEMPSLYGLRSIRAYDAIGLRRHRELLRTTEGFADFAGAQVTTGVDARALDLLGVRWVVAGWPLEEARGTAELAIVEPGKPYRKTLTLEQGQALEMLAGRPRGAPGAAPQPIITIRRPGLGTLVHPSKSAPTLPVTVTGFGSLHSRAPAALRDYATLRRRHFQTTTYVFEPDGEAAELEVTLKVGAGAVALELIRSGVLGPGLVDRGTYGALHLAERTHALPRAFMAPSIVLKQDMNEALAAIREPGFKPLALTVLDRGGAEVRTGDALQGTGTLEAVAVRRVSPEELRILPPHAGVLVVAEAFADGWTAVVDGQPADVFAANVFGRAVVVPPGAREVVFTYRPVWLDSALAVAAALALLLLGGLAFGGGRPREAAGNQVASDDDQGLRQP